MGGVTLPIIVVDAANVVGSTPDGWWRDRHGATERLRDALAPLAALGVAGVEGPVELLLVVEGKGVETIPGVRVIAAPGSGDDTIVDLVREAGPGVTVVTADRGLRERVTALGARVIGPSAVPRRRG